MKYHFIAIEGNIGAGKTTLAQHLAAHYNAHLILEHFAENPFLSLFYENKDKYGLAVELSFLSDRFEQLGNAFKNQDKKQLFVADYTIYKSQIFAQNNLNTEEYQLYLRIQGLIKATLPKPDLFIYLHTPIEKLQAQIKQRGRTYEQNISTTYLEEIQKAYSHFFHKNSDNVLIIDNANIDFNNRNHFNQLVQFLESGNLLSSKELIIE